MITKRNQRWFVDLSLPICENTSEMLPVKVSKIAHREGAEHVIKKLTNKGILTGQRPLKAADFPDGEFLSHEQLNLSVHAGTHLDAPYHFGSLSEGAPAATVDEIPLEWCFGPGVVLDVTFRGQGETIYASDLEKAMRQLDRPINSGDIVLIHTGADRLWGTPEYATSHPGMSVEAVDFLLDKGVQIIGIDTAGFDLPTVKMIDNFELDGNYKHLWPTHFYGRKRKYCHIEKLCNIDKLPSLQGFEIACFPIKITGAGAGWVRVVAIGSL